MFIEESVLKEKMEERTNPRARLGLEYVRKSRGAAVLSSKSNESEARNNFGKYLCQTLILFYDFSPNKRKSEQESK